MLIETPVNLGDAAEWERVIEHLRAQRENMDPEEYAQIMAHFQTGLEEAMRERPEPASGTFRERLKAARLRRRPGD